MQFLPNCIDSYLCWDGTLNSKIGFSGWNPYVNIGYCFPSVAAIDTTPLESVTSATILKNEFNY